MATPIYLCIKGDNEIWQIDTAATVKDGAAFDGTGGSDMATDRAGVLAYFRTNPVDVVRETGLIGGVGAVRNVDLNVEHTGVTVEAYPVVDGVEETSQEISTTLSPGDPGYINLPFHRVGTQFSLDVEVTALSDVARFGKLSAEVIPYRRQR